jgi:AcrR family transcriptional regulator
MERANPDSRARVRDPERTRARILDAAFAEFCAEGLAGARVDRIALRSGVNKRMLYHYFGDKEGLFGELLRQKAGTAAHDRAEAPDTLADALAHWQAHQCGQVKWTRLLMWEALAYGARRIANAAARRAGWEEAVAGLRRAQRDGALRDDLDARQLQLSLVALVTFPVAFPQYTKLITGLSPSDPRFLPRRQRFLRRLAAALAPPS